MPRTHRFDKQEAYDYLKTFWDGVIRYPHWATTAREPYGEDRLSYTKLHCAMYALGVPHTRTYARFEKHYLGNPDERDGYWNPYEVYMDPIIYKYEEEGRTLKGFQEEAYHLWDTDPDERGMTVDERKKQKINEYFSCVQYMAEAEVSDPNDEDELKDEDDEASELDEDIQEDMYIDNQYPNGGRPGVDMIPGQENYRTFGRDARESDVSSNGDSEDVESESEEEEEEEEDEDQEDWSIYPQKAKVETEKEAEADADAEEAAEQEVEGEAEREAEKQAQPDAEKDNTTSAHPFQAASTNEHHSPHETSSDLTFVSSNPVNHTTQNQNPTQDATKLPTALPAPPAPPQPNVPVAPYHLAGTNNTYILGETHHHYHMGGTGNTFYVGEKRKRGGDDTGEKQIDGETESGGHEAPAK